MSVYYIFWVNFPPKKAKFVSNITKISLKTYLITQFIKKQRKKKITSGEFSGVP